MESLNRMAIELVDEALDFAEELDIGAHELDNEATVLDFGVEFPGGVEAGLLLAEIQTAGLATVQTRMDEVAGAPIPHVELSTDHPALALLCSQKAGWELSADGFEGLGSGPARALVGEEEEFARVGYHDAFDLTVLALESDELPDEAVAEQVARMADVETSGVFLPTFPTASVVGSVTTAARA
ncbi:methenyltetrahydromethanopterin cyclohydrolase, partial [Natronoarchaeum mannanilyticum]